MGIIRFIHFPDATHQLCTVIVVVYSVRFSSTSRSSPKFIAQYKCLPIFMKSLMRMSKSNINSTMCKVYSNRVLGLITLHTTNHKFPPAYLSYSLLTCFVLPTNNPTLPKAIPNHNFVYEFTKFHALWAVVTSLYQPKYRSCIVFCVHNLYAVILELLLYQLLVAIVSTLQLSLVFVLETMRVKCLSCARNSRRFINKVWIFIYLLF